VSVLIATRNCGAYSPCHADPRYLDTRIRGELIEACGGLRRRWHGIRSCAHFLQCGQLAGSA
jgi:hypothetical protein